MQRTLPVRRRPNAVDMVQTVVNDLGEHLRNDMVPRVQRSGQDIWYSAVVHIRDGLVQYVDLSCGCDDQSNHPPATPSLLPELIKRAEMWLLRALPTRLVHGYHGLVEVELSMRGGKFYFLTKLMQQKHYSWFELHNGNGHGRQ